MARPGTVARRSRDGEGALPQVSLAGGMADVDRIFQNYFTAKFFPNRFNCLSFFFTLSSATFVHAFHAERIMLGSSSRGNAGRDGGLWGGTGVPGMAANVAAGSGRLSRSLQDSPL